MADIRFTELTDASAIIGNEALGLSQLSTTTTLTATTISASSVGNVLADSGNGFVTAGFAANQQIRISGFTGGGVANNLTATIVSVSAGLLYVDVALTSVAAGDTVTITLWVSRKATPATVQAGAISTATGKTTPVDADALGIIDSAASNVLKKLTWANLKATSKTYTDTLYALIGAITGSGLTMATGRLLGRSTASTGAVEEITVGSGLSLSAGTLTATAAGDVTASANLTDNAVVRGDGGAKGTQTTGVLIDDDNKISGYRGNINTQTGTSYTLDAADTGKIVELSNASAIALTLPATAAVGFACTLVQAGAGQVTFAAGGSGSLRNRQSHTKLAGQWAMASAYVRTNSGGSAAEWVVSGDATT